MPVYEIERYELHAMRYRVESATPAEAVVKLFASEAEPVEQSQDFIDVAEDFGLPAAEHRGLADDLRTLGVSVGKAIPSIRSCEQVGEGHQRDQQW